MSAAVVAGMGFGAGLWLLLRAVRPPRPPLAVALARVDAAARRGPARRPLPAATPRPAAPPSGFGRRLGVLERLLGERLPDRLPRGLLGDRLRADLAVLGVDDRGYTARKLLAAAAVLLTAPLLLVPAAAAAGAPWLSAAWLSVMLALGAIVVPDRRVRARAAAHRRDITAAVAAYLDLVAMRSASGSGVPEALRDAAAVGAGPTFTRIRAALDDARIAGLSPARGLRMLGEELDVAELTDLGAQLEMVGAAGSQAEASLRAKAAALRGRQLADTHGKANERSQTMQVGQVLLGVGFLVFLGYPALAQILAL